MVIGDGPLMADLTALAGQLSIDDHVTFHGFANASEMPELLAALDVVVVPSRSDMRVLVSIEAMAAGTAIVVSDTTAVWEPGDLVADGVTGLVYQSGDPAHFGPTSFAETTASSVRAYLHYQHIAQRGDHVSR